MKLSEFFRLNPRIAIAFSGGVDSAYLLSAAVKSGADVRAYCVKSAFQPSFETSDAERVADVLGVRLRIIEANVLSCREIAENPPDRCYHCKKMIFNEICRAARDDGYSLVADGTNASDDEDDRPGMRAIRELGVRSPLRECGLTKSDIRRLSRDEGLFTWNKPAYACLATRIKCGERITAEKLRATEDAEDFMRSLGFSDLRVRMCGGDAKIQLREEQLSLLVAHREEILAYLKEYYNSVTLDLETRL